MTESTRERAQRVRYETRARRVAVQRIEQVTPGYVRIVLGGGDLEGFQSLGAQDHFKLMLPNVGQTEPVFPMATPDGPQYPQDVARPIMRDYTPRAFDAATNELTIEIVVHERGVASDWAQQATAGQVVGVAGPRGSRVIDYGTFDWVLAAGDETSIPSIARVLEELPAGLSAQVFIEVDGPEDEQTLSTKADATITWVHRNGAVAGTSQALEQAIRGFDFPVGEGYQVYTGEANALRDIRRYVLKEKGLDPEWITFSGHWKHGTADFDHHTPIED